MQDQEEINETLNDLSKDYGETYSKDTSEKEDGWIDEVNKKIAENPTLSKVIQHGNRSGTVVTMVVSNNPLVEKYEKYRDDYDIKEDDYGPIQLKRILEGRRKRKFLKQLIGNDYLDYMGILGYETEDRFVSFLLYFIRIKHLIRIHYFIRVCYTYGEEYYCEHRKINHEEYMNRLDSVSEVIKP